MKEALEGLPGVSSVTFEPRSDTFTLALTPEAASESAPALTEEEVRKAVLGQVVLPGLRGFLGSCNGLLPRIRRGMLRKPGRRSPVQDSSLSPRAKRGV